MSARLARSALRTPVRPSVLPTARLAPFRRAYSSGSNASQGIPSYAYGIGALAVLGGGAWYLSNQDSVKNALASKPQTPDQVDYQAVYNDIAALLDSETYDDGSYGPTLIRLAWHCSGTYCKDTKNGGSNGATMRFHPEADHGANAGLKVVRDLLEPVKAKHPGITYSDLWTLAGVVAIQEMQGPKVGWRWGRQDGYVENCTPDGRLPDGDKDQDHVRKIFYRMGFNDQEIVALSGAHALGRCHKDRSGFDGPWTFSPTTFTNDYFKLLMNEKWSQRKWEGPLQFEDKSKALMMLKTDLSLVKDKSFRKFTEKYAKSQEAFFQDFSKVFAKLIELGVPDKNFGERQPMFLKSTEEQTAAK